MRNFWRGINAVLGRYLSPAARGIFLANVIVFLVFVLAMPASATMQWLFFRLMETPADAVGHLYVWQFFTYMFLHGGFWHLFWNMLMLWCFASRLERRWGPRYFLRFYLVVGVGAGLFHAVAAYLLAPLAGGGDLVSPTLGASGAIYGLLLAYALNYPNDTVLLYFVLPIRVKYLMVILILITILFSIESAALPGGSGDHISHLTHLGGLLVAFVYLRGGDWMRRRGARRRGPTQVHRYDFFD